MYAFRYLTLLMLLTSMASPVTAGHVAVEAGFQQDNDAVHLAGVQQEYEGEQPDVLMPGRIGLAQPARDLCIAQPDDKKTSSTYSDFHARAPPAFL